jgi:hypothetical protein
LALRIGQIAIHKRTQNKSASEAPAREDQDELEVPEDLVETIVLPGLFEATVQIKEDLSEIHSQIEKQRTRVRELRERKLADPGTSRSISVVTPAQELISDRCLLRRGQPGVSGCRRDDRHLPTRDDLHSIYGCSYVCITNLIQVCTFYSRYLMIN